MPRIPALPNFSGTPAADDELPLYDTSADITYGVTVADLAVAVAAESGAPTRATVETVTGTTQTPATGVDGRYFRCTNASGCAVTIPAEADQNFPVGTMLTYEQAGATAVSFAGDAGVTLNHPAAYVASTAEQFAVVQVCKVGADEWTLYGHLLAA